MRPILALAVLLMATPAHAAQSYDSCNGTIATLPTTLSTQGTWCLKSDLATTLATGNAITVATNNVTIDCNGFKLGNLGAGIDTQATGIYANDRSVVSVRGCNIRGFKIAINLDGHGHLVEDNRIEASRNSALRVSGDAMIVRRNLVLDTGGQSLGGTGIFFAGDADIRDNIVSGMFPLDGATGPSLYGIYGASQAHYTIRGNVVRGLTTLGDGGSIVGIRVGDGEGDIIDNSLSAVPGAIEAIAIRCDGSDGFVRDNRASGFLTLTSGCPAEGVGNELRN